MRNVPLLLTVLFFSGSLFAQKNGSVKGVAFDTLAKQPVSSATITVLDKKDSSLVSFTMTDNSGGFELRGIPNGEYRLMITHVNYHNSNNFFTIGEAHKERNLGNIALNDKTKVLDEVVVTSEAPPVTLVGDTVQYNAGSFKVVPNANVEQLLKKLPGVKVDKDGTVTAQGEKVSRVLVDGKEFFGNDPKIATRNLPADAIDKVQVYDKQSDQAQLTGFEDGNYEKTINLKLKKDKKKGVFGKVMAGAGDKERYEGRFNVNSFKGARQLSAIGMGNNTNAEGFSFMDIMNFTGALNQMRQGGGGGNININLSADEAASFGLGNGGGGINTAWGGGLNYNNIIGTKHDFQSNYFYNRFNPNTKTRIHRQNIIGSSSNFYDENSYSDNLNNSHRFNLNDLFQIDSMHSLRINPSLSLQKTRNRSQTNYTTVDENGDLVNQGFSNNNAESDGYNFYNNLVFRKKFRRKGRTLSLTLQTTLNETNGNSERNSIISYYNAGSIFRRDTLDQRSETNSSLRGYTARAVYTEPLWKRSLLELSAAKSNMKNKSDKVTYDYNDASDKYDAINQQLTNNFENDYGFTSAGVRIRKQARKYNYSVGLTWQNSQLEGKIISGIKDSVIKKDFTNLLPNATFRYNFTRFKNFSLNYSASTNQPTLAQLQPVPDNSNPLYIREGNPDLKQEFSHNLRANLNLLSPFGNKNFFMFFSGTLTNNKIVSYDTLDLTTGIKRTMPVNVDGVYNWMANVNYSFPLKFMKSTFEFGNRIRYNKGKQFINKLANEIRTFSWGPELRLDINPGDKINFALSANYDYNNAKYSALPAQNNNYISQEYNASVDWQLPKNFFLSTSMNYTINDQLSSGFNAKIPIWNAAISKQFLKYNRGELKLAATDLLNRNVSISRSTTSNYIQDREVNALKRFFLLSFTYSLSKSGLNTAAGPGIKVISR